MRAFVFVIAAVNFSTQHVYKNMPIITRKSYKNAIYSIVRDIANFNAFKKMN